MIDWSRVEELRDEVGAEDFAEIARLFLDEVEEALAALHADAPVQALEAGFHAIKSSALNLGFSGLAALCQTAESAAAAGTCPDPPLAEAQALFAASRAEFLGRLALAA